MPAKRKTPGGKGPGHHFSGKALPAVPPDFAEAVDTLKAALETGEISIGGPPPVPPAARRPRGKSNTRPPSR